MASPNNPPSTAPTTRQFGLRRNKGPEFGGIATASTPNLNQLYAAQSSATRLAQRKSSFTALTPNSLAAIPDDTEYAFNSVLTSTSSANKMPSPFTPGSLATPGEGISIGDLVDVPGAMMGTVRFIGPVQGRKGMFAGVELHHNFATRGKNSGDVDGVSYFTTSQPGAGIFLPVSKAVKREPSSASSGNVFPMAPRRDGLSGLKVGDQNSLNFMSPTLSFPKFSQSVGPGHSTSPTEKKSRMSLPRPESPARQMQMTPQPRLGLAKPVARGQPRFRSPSINKFAQSVRGTAGDPSKRPPIHTRKNSFAQRSASALGNSSLISTLDEDDTTPIAPSKFSVNGSTVSGSIGLKIHPPSRAMSRATSRAASRVGNHGNDDEVVRLKGMLDDRDQQLKEQAAALSEMENSLMELQGLIEVSERPPGGSTRQGSVEDKSAIQLRALLRERNEKIATLTAEFDAHRADFRSTIDTLEMASTETERVYEKKIEDLLQELQDISERTSDVDAVAAQLKGLEELVQELEEGLEDARRGEAEARGEVEFLRGEVERTRSELRREREKAQATMQETTKGGENGERMVSLSSELEQKEDEIRGLKAIIHSLSRDSVSNETPDATPKKRAGSLKALTKHESVEERLVRENLERELSELRALVDDKSRREEELEYELEGLRRGGVVTGGSAYGRKSTRESSVTVIPPTRSPTKRQGKAAGAGHTRGASLDTMAESDSYSTATDHNILWCEICETGGHDILTCTNMFGPDSQQSKQPEKGITDAATGKRDEMPDMSVPDGREEFKQAPRPPVKTPDTPPRPVYTLKTLANPMESGPVAGKNSGVVDAARWCAVCEREGHESIDCPFEGGF